MVDEQPSRRAHPKGILRIGRIAPDDEEVAHADHVGRCLRIYDGREIGDCTGRDGDPGVRVDFLFDSTTDPVALEITSICDSPVRALGTELHRLEANLDALALDQSLGTWVLGIRTGSRITKLRPLLTEFLARQGQRSDEATLYSGDVAPPDLSPDDLRLLVGLLEHGLITASRVGGDHGVSVLPPVSIGTSESGFGTLLRYAVTDNAEKLSETRPRETHLFVALDLRVSDDPRHTPPPALPAAIDVLWVYLGYWNAKYDYRLWRTTRAEPRWQLLDHPLGQPPTWHAGN